MSSLIHIKLDFLWRYADNTYMKNDGKVASKVAEKIERGGSGSIWTYENFKGLPFGAVSKALSRLAAENKIVRVRRGVYYFPKETVLGKTEATTNDVINAIFAKKKKAIYPDAATAAYNLRITTQVPAVITVVGDDNYRTVDYNGTKVKISRRSMSHLKNATDEEVYIFEILRGINKIPGASPKDVINRLKVLLKKMELKDMLRLAKKEPPRVRALLGALCSEIKLKSELVKDLKDSLNPLTKYKLGLSEFLLKASEWNIE